MNTIFDDDNSLNNSTISNTAPSELLDKTKIKSCSSKRGTRWRCSNSNHYFNILDSNYFNNSTFIKIIYIIPPIEPFDLS